MSIVPRSNAHGLTLVELLVAMAILVTVTGSTMLIFRGITQAWRSGQLKTDRYQQARLIFDLFARELSSCVANPRFPFVGLEAAPGIQLKAASTQEAVFFVGTLPGRAGLVERGYWVDGGGRLMCHDQEPADGDYAATGTDEACGSDIVQFDVSYFDGTAWIPQWDGRTGAAQAGRIPKAIQIRLTIGQHHGESFETVLHIPAS